MRTIVITNQKGGCGKTTTAVNLAAGLAAGGVRVLLIDLDPQGHATLGLGIKSTSVSDTFTRALVDSRVPLQAAIVRTPLERVDLVPSTILLAAVELDLHRKTSGKHWVLREQLMGVDHQYDVCLIDCAPALGLLAVNALVACTDILVPVQAHYYALQGLEQLMETIRILKNRYPLCGAEVMGLLLTFVDDRTSLSKRMQTGLRQRLPDLVFETVIHTSTQLSEAPSSGESVLTFAPDCRASHEYRSLAHEIAGRLHLVNDDVTATV